VREFGWLQRSSGSPERDVKFVSGVSAAAERSGDLESVQLKGRFVWTTGERMIHGSVRRRLRG